LDEPADELVRAAGGVLWRRSDDGSLEVLLIHRKRHRDWTFPKGKLDPGETWEQAAVREVWEEAAVVPVLGDELGTTEYRDRDGRPKQVRYWAMIVAADAGFTPNHEVDARAWEPVAAASRRLSYDHDRAILGRLLELLGRS
jgi:8-oxo-dGTP pyrophosphatase MutT (NUDIX family)